MNKLINLLVITLSVILLPFFKYKYRNKKILLVGGHEGELFIDNGKAFYNYLLKHQSDYETYWIINKNSADKHKIASPVIRGSLKNYLYFFNSNGAFFSHSGSDIAPIAHNLFKNKNCTKVNLEHGITGLKKAKFGNTEQTQKKFGPVADLTIAASNFERDIKINSWNIDPSEVKVTGFARFDYLKTKTNYRHEIIFMPTWREWLADLDDEEFKKSYFYLDLMQLLTDHSFVQLLEEKDYQLKIYIHFYFHKFIKNFNILYKYYLLFFTFFGVPLPTTHPSPSVGLRAVAVGCDVGFRYAQPPSHPTSSNNALRPHASVDRFF